MKQSRSSARGPGMVARTLLLEPDMATIMTFKAAVQQRLDAIVEHELLLHEVVEHPLQWGGGVGWGGVQKRPFLCHTGRRAMNHKYKDGRS